MPSLVGSEMCIRDSIFSTTYNNCGRHHNITTLTSPTTTTVKTQPTACLLSASRQRGDAVGVAGGNFSRPTWTSTWVWQVSSPHSGWRWESFSAEATSTTLLLLLLPGILLIPAMYRIGRWLTQNYPPQRASIDYSYRLFRHRVSLS